MADFVLRIGKIEEQRLSIFYISVRVLAVSRVNVPVAGMTGVRRLSSDKHWNVGQPSYCDGSGFVRVMERH